MKEEKKSKEKNVRENIIIGSFSSFGRGVVNVTYLNPNTTFQPLSHTTRQPAPSGG